MSKQQGLWQLDLVFVIMFHVQYVQILWNLIQFQITLAFPKETFLGDSNLTFTIIPPPPTLAVKPLRKWRHGALKKDPKQMGKGKNQEETTRKTQMKIQSKIK